MHRRMFNSVKSVATQEIVADVTQRLTLHPIALEAAAGSHTQHKSQSYTSENTILVPKRCF